MALTPRFRGRVDAEGVLRLEPAEAGPRRRWLLTLRGQRVEVLVRKWRSKRSNEQNRYYRGVIVAMVAEAMGEEVPEHAHQALAWHFLKLPDEPGKLARRRSTTELTTVEMERYHEDCRMLAAKTWGLYIPLPNEVVDDAGDHTT
jgi:hypothetical protein